MAVDRHVTLPPDTPEARTSLKAICFLGAFAVFTLAAVTMALPLSREQDVGDLRLGQRVKVDDGSCPAGQIKEVSGTKMTSTGVVRSRKCIPRFGPKTK